MAALGLLGLFLAICLAIVIREAAALARLGRLDRVHKAAEAARSSGDLKAARVAARRVAEIYRGRPDLRWGLDRLKEREAEAFDALVDELSEECETQREEILAGKRNLGCRRLIEKHPALVRRFEMDNDHCVFDLDTPAAYMRFQTRVRIAPSSDTHASFG